MSSLSIIYYTQRNVNVLLYSLANEVALDWINESIYQQIESRLSSIQRHQAGVAASSGGVYSDGTFYT